MRRCSLTDQARRALAAACRLARDRCQAFVGTDALLYAVLQAAPRLPVLEGIPGRERLQREIAEALEAAPRAPRRRELQLSPRAREALEAAEREARALGAGATDLDHIVLGLLCAERKGLAGLVLEQYGLAAEDLRSSLRGPRTRGRRNRRCPRCHRPDQAWRAVLGPRTLCQACFRLDLSRGQAVLGRDREGPQELGLFHQN